LILSTLILSIALLRSSNPTGLLFWCVIGLLAGIYLFVQGFRLLQRRHLILNTPVSKIRSASLGMVELSGLAVGPYTMVAPITERPCYYYRTLAWEWKQSGKNKQWVKVASECTHVPFFLDDNTGKVMVDPRGADLDLHCDFEQEFCDSFFTTKQEAPDSVRSFLLRHGVSTTNKIKVEEYCIKPKNALFLLGTLDENHDLEVTPQPIQDPESTSLLAGNPLSFNLEGTLSFLGAGNGSGGTPVDAVPLGELRVGGHTLREAGYDKSDLYRTGFDKSAVTTSGQVIHLSPAPGPAKAADMTQQQKITAALLQAGIRSPAAWAAAGVTQSSVVVNRDPEGSPHVSVSSESVPGAQQPATPPDGFDLHPPVVLMKGKNNPTFLISWRSQRDLARSLGWKCTLMIWGGPALALLCLYGLRTIAHWF
jgi:E3 Ubiquitin ligase